MADIKVEDRKPGEVIFNGFMLILSIVLLWQAFDISGFDKFSSPGTFPMSAAFIMFIFSSITLIKSIKKNRIDQAGILFFNQILPLKIAVMIGMIIVFSLTIESIGFLVTSFILLTASFYIYYKKNVLLAAVISVLSLLVVYGIFRLVFLVILPEGVIPEAEILAFFSDLFS
ncbi:MAG: tripartite tricarboxylate transporter TctB family protein [Vibrio sp.]